MSTLVPLPGPSDSDAAPWQSPRLTLRGRLILIRRWITPRWVGALAERFSAWRDARYFNHRMLVVLPRDPEMRRVIREAIETGADVGLQTKAYRAMYDPRWTSRSCNVFVIGGLEIPSPTVFVILGLDPRMMQKIYFHWGKASVPDPKDDEQILQWRARHRQTFTDILPFARIRWHQRESYGGSIPLGETVKRPPELAITLEQALAECGAAPA